MLNELELFEAGAVAGGDRPCKCGGGGCSRCSGGDLEVFENELRRPLRLPRRMAQRAVSVRRPRGRHRSTGVWGSPVVLASDGSSAYSGAAITIASSSPILAPEPAAPLGQVSGRGLESAKPEDLVLVKTEGSGMVRLQRQVASALFQMQAAARRDGFAAPLLTLRTSRSTSERQRRAWDSAVQIHGNAAEAALWCTRPQTPADRGGRIVELYLGTPNAGAAKNASRSLPAYRWLRANARRFGFGPSGRTASRWEFTRVTAGRVVEGEVAAGAAVAAGTAAGLLTASELGLGIFQAGMAVPAVLGDHTLRAVQGSRFVHQNTPADLTRYETTYEFSIQASYHLVDYRPPMTFVYRISWEHNGYDISNVTISNSAANDLQLSSMVVDMVPTMYGPENAVRLSMLVNVSGRWNPSFLGNYEFFPGKLLIDAAGACSIQQPIYQADGKVSFQSLSRIGSRVVFQGRAPAPNPGPPGPPAPSGNCTVRTLKGCSGPIVTELQQRLNRWRSVKGMSPIPVDGLFTPETANAVVQFKQANNLHPTDAVAGEKTWRLLRSSY